MGQSKSTSLPVPAFAGGTKAITLTPVVGTPRREYAEMFIPGEEKLEDGEMRVTVLGSGNPWVTRGQASSSILVEVGNAERDLLVFDLGSGSLANYASLKLPVNKLDKVFLSHLHADHTSDLLTLVGSYAKVPMDAAILRARSTPSRAWSAIHRGVSGMNRSETRRKNEGMAPDPNIHRQPSVWFHASVPCPAMK